MEPTHEPAGLLFRSQIIYGDEQLTKRGNAAFQARLDKTVLAMHVILAHR